MAESIDKFNWSGMWSVNGEGNDTSLMLGEYNGYFSLTVFANRQVAAKFPVNANTQYAIEAGLQQIVKAVPNTRMVAATVNKWNPDTRKYTFQAAVVLGKTEDGQYYIEIKDTNSSPMKFLFKWPASLLMGSDTMSDVEKNHAAFEVFKRLWCKQIPEMFLLSRFNFTPPSKNGGSRPQNTPKASTQNTSSDEEVLF